jgi:hypothetical protein
MASNATTQITILWADEVKQAAAAMHAWHDCKDDEQRHKLMVVAFNAALVALWGIKEDTALVMLGSRDIQRVATDEHQVELDLKTE